MRRTLPLALIGGIAALIVVGFSAPAFAYPQFQFSSGTTRCSQCHYSPAGGGLITSWGRDESADTLSTFGGNGGFLHGAWTPPSWVALGADVRVAGLRNDDGGSQAPQSAWFPMQTDLYSRFAFDDTWSLYLEAGVRGETRPASGFSDTGIGQINTDIATVGNRFITREHYLMWRPSATGPYARIGRFYAPYGLRFVEHIYYVRRFTGYNLYDETYTASGGYVDEDWELHVSVFTPPPSGAPDFFSSVGTRESGGAAYFELRLGGMGAVGAQTRIGHGVDHNRYQGGLVGKLWLDPAKLLVLGEADFARLQVAAASAGVTQFISYLGVNYFPVKGLMASLAYERFQEDISLGKTGHNAYDVQANWFPWSHFELVLLYRYQTVSAGLAGQTDGPATSLLMGQLHYYL
jgi:hypothetical protein